MLKLYEINNCNASLLSGYIYQEGITAVDAVFKATGTKTIRSSNIQVDFLVTPVEKQNGYYYKRGNQVGLSIIKYEVHNAYKLA